MTPAQRSLARHALGLPNGRNRSFRNRYVVPPHDPAHAGWVKMVAAGWARDVRPRSAPPSGQAGQPVGGMAGIGAGDTFCLTLEGAGLAVEPGERLDPEDFESIDGRAQEVAHG